MAVLDAGNAAETGRIFPAPKVLGVAAGAGAGLAVAFIPSGFSAGVVIPSNGISKPHGPIGSTPRQLTARRKELRQRRERCTLLARGGEAGILSLQTVNRFAVQRRPTALLEPLFT